LSLASEWISWALYGLCFAIMYKSKYVELSYAYYIFPGGGGSPSQNLTKLNVTSSNSTFWACSLHSISGHYKHAKPRWLETDLFNNCRVAKYMWLKLGSLFPSHFATRAMSMVTMVCHIKVNWKNIKFFIKVQYKTMFSCNQNLQLCSSSTLLQYPFSGCRI
jgi:hypothetical protein